jgi:GTP-binding protein EngB required for normal cell division
VTTLPGDRLAAFDEALSLAAPRLDPELLEPALQVRAKVDERLARGDGVVVAALAGGTGSGKSSLFNALAGADLSEVGVRRPTTGGVLAWSIGDPASTGAVLDWLGVGTRFATAPTAELPEGMVVLDLPDVDSVAAEHRALADTFVARVDVLVWVVDPLKYAQNTLHAGYLRRLALHASVVVVVLNQVDRLDAEGRRACLEDLRRLLTEEGLGTARVLATSAVTGEGVDDLRALLATEARTRRAVGARLTADVRTVAAALRTETGGPIGAQVDGRRLVEALSAVSGVATLVEVARARYAAAARSATRPILPRLLAALWGLVTRLFRGLAGSGPARATGPGRQETSPAAVRHALARVAESSAALPVPARAHLRGVLAEVAADLPRAVARATDRVELSPPRRRWWPALAGVWSLVELVALAGVVWLAGLALLDYLRLPQPDLPNVIGALPWPTALLIAGVAGWLLVLAVRNVLVGAGAARHRRAVLGRLRAAVAAVAEEHALARIRAELAAHDALVAALDRAQE